MASKSHRFCKGRKRVHVLYIERKKNLVLDTARMKGGNRIVMTNLRFLPNIKTRDEAKNISSSRVKTENLKGRTVTSLTII